MLIENKDISYEDSDFFVLPMCIYPSGELHVGHLRSYTYTQIFVNYYNLLGKKPFTCLGWDALGLPAEIAAIKNNLDPKEWTKRNILKMNSDLESFGFHFSKKYTINTMETSYYRMDQKIFGLMFEKKLIYKKESEMPFCETCNTVLALEQSVNDQCWRCKNKIIYKFTEQYFIKITNYAKELFDCIEILNWPNSVKEIQRNWIGFNALNCILEDGTFVSINSNFLNKEKKQGVKVIHNGNTFFVSEKVIETSPQSEKPFKEEFVCLLKDWCISRQRSWGTPLPLTECVNCGLYYSAKINYDIPSYALGISSEEYRSVDCEKCPLKALKVPHTMDTFFSSSWYMYRYTDPDNMEKPFSNPNIKIDLYTGGIEHAAMHLIYARFFHKFLRDSGFLNSKEPFHTFIPTGMVLGRSVFCLTCNEYQKKSVCSHKKIYKNEKMSKSKLNGVGLSQFLEDLDPEILKFYILFAAPYDKDFVWKESDIIGVKKFFNRLDTFFSNLNFILEENEIINDLISYTYLLLEKLINYQSLSWNVFIAKLFEIFNLFFVYGCTMRQAKIFLNLFYIVSKNKSQNLASKINYKFEWFSMEKSPSNFFKLFFNNKFHSLIQFEKNFQITKKNIINYLKDKNFSIEKFKNIFFSKDSINIILDN